MNIPVAITAVLENAFNRYIELDPDGHKRLAKLAGKVISIDITGLDTKLTIIPGSDSVHIMSYYDGESDTQLKGAPFSLLRMSLGKNSEQQLFSGDVEISGDTETGQQFNRILNELDIDWEEHLSHITGDVIAHQIGYNIRKFFSWGKDAEDSILKDTAEYLEEEAQLVTTPFEVEEFNRHVDQIRNDAERLSARISRLHDKLL
ncbi:MAG: sterol-binding protein [Gammaproteobacteria bacterium]|nr:sterol-binding protein [Gammaproteobacteria bacterium]